MTNFRALWLLSLITLQAVGSTALAIEPRASVIHPTNADYIELPSGVRIWGTQQLSPATQSDLNLRAAANGWCSAGSLSNEGSESSPLITDCQTIQKQVLALVGSNNAYFGRSECNPDKSGLFTCYFPVVSFQTCMFGVSTINAGLDLSIRMGWQDVGNLISTSIAKFGNNPASGKVGASGETQCPEELTGLLNYATGWGIYHS